jgi:hypothetical protein
VIRGNRDLMMGDCAWTGGVLIATANSEIPATLANHCRTASCVSSFMHDPSVLLGEVDYVIDHVSPAAILLGRFPEHVEGCREVGQETANHRIPFPHGQVRFRNHQQVDVAVLPRVSPRMAPEENDLLRVQPLDNSLNDVVELFCANHGSVLHTQAYLF